MPERRLAPMPAARPVRIIALMNCAPSTFVMIIRRDPSIVQKQMILPQAHYCETLALVTE
jgi:hypothetical protein